MAVFEFVKEYRSLTTLVIILLLIINVLIIVGRIRNLFKWTFYIILNTLIFLNTSLLLLVTILTIGTGSIFSILFFIFIILIDFLTIFLCNKYLNSSDDSFVGCICIIFYVLNLIFIFPILLFLFISLPAINFGSTDRLSLIILIFGINLVILLFNYFILSLETLSPSVRFFTTNLWNFIVYSAISILSLVVFFIVKYGIEFVAINVLIFLCIYLQLVNPISKEFNRWVFNYIAVELVVLSFCGYFNIITVFASDEPISVLSWNGRNHISNFHELQTVYYQNVQFLEENPDVYPILQTVGDNLGFNPGHAVEVLRTAVMLEIVQQNPAIDTDTLTEEVRDFNVLDFVSNFYKIQPKLAKMDAAAEAKYAEQREHEVAEMKAQARRDEEAALKEAALKDAASKEAALKEATLKEAALKEAAEKELAVKKAAEAEMVAKKVAFTQELKLTCNKNMRSYLVQQVSAVEFRNGLVSSIAHEEPAASIQQSLIDLKHRRESVEAARQQTLNTITQLIMAAETESAATEYKNLLNQIIGERVEQETLDKAVTHLVEDYATREQLAKTAQEQAQKLVQEQAQKLAQEQVSKALKKTQKAAEKPSEDNSLQALLLAALNSIFNFFGNNYKIFLLLGTASLSVFIFIKASFSKNIQTAGFDFNEYETNFYSNLSHCRTKESVTEFFTSVPRLSKEQFNIDFCMLNKVFNGTLPEVSPAVVWTLNWDLFFSVAPTVILFTAIVYSIIKSNNPNFFKIKNQ